MSSEWSEMAHGLPDNGTRRLLRATLLLVAEGPRRSSKELLKRSSAVGESLAGPLRKDVMDSRIRGYTVAILIALAAIACGGPVDPSKNKTETFSRFIRPGFVSFGQDTFSMSKTGEVSITVTKLDPPSTAFFAVILYFQNCASIIQENQFATVGRTAISTTLTPGTYCVVVADEGFFTGPETYTVTVSHP